MDLHPGERVIYEGHPSWRSTFGFYVLGVLIVAAAVAIGVVADQTGIGLAVGGGLLLLLLIVGWLKRITTGYLITDRRLQIRRGILARRTEETRIDRIVDVTVNQSLWKRIVRIGDVDFDNASGGQGSDLFRFTGVANPHGVVRAVDLVHERGTAPAEQSVGR